MLAMPSTATGSRYAAGYIRESTEDFDRDLDRQKAGQREDVVAVASRDGTDPATLLWYDDWGRSGSEHAKRPAQERLLADVRAGRVAVIYARSLDRLMRSTQRLRDLWEACKAGGTRIVTMREGDVSADKIESNPSAWMFVQSIMTAAEYESRVGRVRAVAAVATKRRDGTPLGRIGYGEDPKKPEENVRAVLDAWDRAGSFNATARLLNEENEAAQREGRPVPAPTRLGPMWTGTTVSRIIQRHRKVPRPTRQGVSAKAPRIFTGLLLCDWCVDHGRPGRLTSMPRRAGWNGQKTDTVAYFCHNARYNLSHPKPLVVAESKVRAWAERELSAFKTVAASRMSGTTPEDAAEVQGRRDALDAKRARVVDMYADGTITKGERDRRLAEVRQALEALEARGYMLSVLGTPGALTPVPLIDFNGDPADVNAELRQLWTAIHMRHEDGVFRAVKPDWVPGAREWAEGRGGEEVER